MTFKVGDRVRLTGPSWGESGSAENPTIGEIVTVSGINSNGDPVFNYYPEDRTYDSDDLLSIEDPDWSAELVEDSPFEQSVHRVTGKIADLLIAKNKAYGDSALNPVRIFSKASRIEQLNVRIDDKISRIQRGTDFGDEDTVRDLIGYLVLRLIAEESE